MNRAAADHGASCGAGGQFGKGHPNGHNTLSFVSGTNRTIACDRLILCL